MSPEPTSLTPSKTVERIREILVGRQLDRLHDRLDRLEQRPPGIGVSEERMLAAEAQLEALRDHVRRDPPTGHSAADSSALLELREETRRLSTLIRTIVAERMDASGRSGEIASLETRVGSWLGEWQRAVHQQSIAREEALANRLRHEVAQLWEATEAQITGVQSRCAASQAVEERFRGIARAARALADSAWPDHDKSTPDP